MIFAANFPCTVVFTRQPSRQVLTCVVNTASEIFQSEPKASHLFGSDRYLQSILGQSYNFYFIYPACQQFAFKLAGNGTQFQ